MVYNSWLLIDEVQAASLFEQERLFPQLRHKATDYNNTETIQQLLNGECQLWAVTNEHGTPNAFALTQNYIDELNELMVFIRFVEGRDIENIINTISVFEHYAIKNNIVKIQANARRGIAKKAQRIGFIEIKRLGKTSIIEKRLDGKKQAK